MKEKLLIGTNNPGKIKRWSPYFGDVFDIVSLKDCGIEYDVEESLDDMKGNAIKKATTYAKLSGYLTLSEDTGFFIEELNGLPGTAVRRWGGELKNEVSDEDFLKFFKEKVKKLKNLNAHFEYEIAIALPDGTYSTINAKSYGYIDREKLEKLTSFQGGFPLSHCYVNNINNKTWMDCTEDEKKERDKIVIEKVRKVFEEYLKNNKLSN